MTLSRWRAVLGYGGLLPFVTFTLLIWLAPAPVARYLVFAQTAYGAVILTFVGAIHWGRSLTAEPGSGAGALIWSVLPSLWALAALPVAPRIGLVMLIGGLVLAWALDRWVFFASERGSAWHAEFMRLRGRLSAVAVLCLLATLAAPASA
jgi:hypothetical protein